MTVAQKFPEDLEEVIYQVLSSGQGLESGMTIPEVTIVVAEKTKTDVDPEVIFGFVRRMDQEGMVEKISDNKYKGVKFDAMCSY